ncbi:hypothetical protein COCSUDRAFT_67371 [Coccomyxa subellipsoidea C-169]|uniref:Rad1-domain-containing protein n=1 Tax=Coccomyxa subellipsoidea (strain C-169) TaxID=574566 RepID=I0YPY3_COCSC|nr:hypothetical protein COCSUDRAFT_67371 [Coccomyxa subellipsoidea C-169]EIE20452.1 hypothetical protein COCSUDRAFT_67371 [Coccomyxa subellipsoidea C-169]|eukprot:XP_005644996.1 hypothetical protein COCSUDRAFT_67371 [Coccomyxa subellipsoidea C-169]
MAVQQACLKMANVKGLVAILQGIKSSHKAQLCTMSINSDGIAIRWEDASKSLQSSVWLSSELFSHYDCPWARKPLGLHFARFVDTLNVFALGSGAELVLRFPGPNEELICEMTEDGSMAQLCTYARIDSVEVPFTGDLMDSWEDPASFFLMNGDD